MHGVEEEEEEEEERARPIAEQDSFTCRSEEGWSHEQRGGGVRGVERTKGW
jgi:hypothetical protein